MKTKKLIGYHVQVGVRYAGDFGFGTISGRYRTLEETKKCCDHIASVILERVKKFDDDRGNVEVIEEAETVCSHCGRDWTEDGRSNCCCDADVAEEESRINALSDAELEKAARRAESYSEQYAEDAEKFRAIQTKRVGERFADSVQNAVREAVQA